MRQYCRVSDHDHDHNGNESHIHNGHDHDHVEAEHVVDEELGDIGPPRFVDMVQGADVADGAVWLSTSDDTNELFRVDLKTGQVDDLGSAGHVPGEGEGIDATQLKSGLLHVLTIDPQRNPNWFGHFRAS